MKTAGLIGGTGPESTVDYYRSIIALYRERTRDGSYPLLLINSIDLQKMRDLVADNLLADLTTYLAAEIRKLAAAGADFALLTAHTPHIVFDALQAGSPVPLISIVETARDAAQARALKRLGLLGTVYTMQGRFYFDVFRPAGIELVVPNPEEQTFVHDRYMNELVPGVFLPETRQAFGAVIERLKREEGIDGLILAGTELPLLLREGVDFKIPVLDTTQLHVERIVDRLLS